MFLLFFILLYTVVATVLSLDASSATVQVDIHLDDVNRSLRHLTSTLKDFRDEFEGFIYSCASIHIKVRFSDVVLQDESDSSLIKMEISSSQVTSDLLTSTLRNCFDTESLYLVDSLQTEVTGSHISISKSFDIDTVVNASIKFLVLGDWGKGKFTSYSR